MEDWKMYIVDPKKETLDLCWGSLDQGSGNGGGWGYGSGYGMGNGYGWSGGEGWDNGDGSGFGEGWGGNILGGGKSQTDWER
jgi:hypothetical protein